MRRSTRVVLPVPDGAETMKSRPRRLLDILDLFPHLLEFSLRRDDQLGDSKTIGLRANRVHFAIHLLQEEVELASTGFGTERQRVPVGQMRAKARDLLADVRLSRGAYDFLRDEGLVDRKLGADLVDALRQPHLIH